MGGNCTKDELENSAFIKINNKEIQPTVQNKPTPHISKDPVQLSPSPNYDFKNSSYNLLDINGFIPPESEKTLSPLSNTRHRVSPTSTPKLEIKERRRSSEISILRLPSEEKKPENKTTPAPNSKSRALKNQNNTKSKRPTFSKAPSLLEHKKILNPPQFKSLKRPIRKAYKRPESKEDTNAKLSPKAASQFNPYGQKKLSSVRKTFSYRVSEKRPSNRKFPFKSPEKEKTEEKPLIKKESPAIISSKLNKNKKSIRQRELRPKPKDIPSSQELNKKSLKKNDSDDDWLTISIEKSPLKKQSTKKSNFPKHRAQKKLPVKSSSDPDLALVKNETIKNHSNKTTRIQKSKSSMIGGYDKPFTNISYVKSATHSVESNVSNFESRTKIETFPDKKTTLSEAGLGKELKLTNKFTQKDFKQKKEAYNEAMQQLQSGDWEKEIMGLNSIVSLAKSDPEIIKHNIQMVVRLLTGTVKNLRSQVCRSGAQAFAELYLHIGRSMEGESDKIIPLLLNKAVDTNKFIRQDCNTALDTAMENISVYKGLSALLETGVEHKNVVARINTARIFSNIIQTLGAEKVMGSSKELQSLVFVKGCALLADGSLEVRNHAKEAFKELSSHKNYSSILNKLVPETQRRYIQKTLDSFQHN